MIQEWLCYISLLVFKGSFHEQLEDIALVNGFISLFAQLLCYSRNILNLSLRKRPIQLILWQRLQDKLVKCLLTSIRKHAPFRSGVLPRHSLCKRLTSIVALVDAFVLRDQLIAWNWLSSKPIRRAVLLAFGLINWLANHLKNFSSHGGQGISFFACLWISEEWLSFLTDSIWISCSLICDRVLILRFLLLFFLLSSGCLL